MTIDEILAAMPEPSAEGDHEYLVIDPATRSITVPEAEKIFGVTGDELADRKYFICPRIVGDGLDLSGMFIRVNFRNANGEEDGYLVNDVAVSGDYVTFSWLLSKKVADYKGQILFGVCADLPNTSDRRMPDWNTTMASGEVLEGLDPDDGDVEAETSDVVTQLRAETAAQTAAVEACGAAQVDVVEAAGAAATQEAVAAIQAQGEATRASIPEDYTTLASTVDRLTRDRAAAIVCEAEGTAIQVQDASNDPLQGLRIFGKSTQDGDPTPDNPVEIASLAAPVVTVAGKNLLNPVGASQTNKGVTFTNNGDGSFTAKGTATGAVGFALTDLAKHPIYLYKGVKYTQSLEVLTGTKPTLALIVPSVKDADGNISYNYFTDNQSKTAAKDYAIYSYTLYMETGAAVDFTFRVQLEAVGTASPWEPHKEPQALTITTPGSLPGIPVASGGNYTDANGQQWVADEVDLARGVYVQRVGRLVLDNSIAYYYDSANAFFHTQANLADAAAWETRLLCSHFTAIGGDVTMHGNGWLQFGSGKDVRFKPGTFTTLTDLAAWLEKNTPTVLHVLATPVEIALTDVEVQAFRALHSYKPTTTVLNDAGAWMALEYAADPKTYIDNKLAALVAAKN